MTAPGPGAARAPIVRRPRRYRWLALAPPVGMLAGVPLANRVEPYVLGLPFLLFWVAAWVVISSGTMATIGALDRRRDRSGGGPMGAAE